MAGIGYKTFGKKIGFPNLQTFADRNRGIAESTTAAYTNKTATTRKS